MPVLTHHAFGLDHRKRIIHDHNTGRSVEKGQCRSFR